MDEMNVYSMSSFISYTTVMVTITFNELAHKPLQQNLHFDNLLSFLDFLKENNYVTEFDMIDDIELSPKVLQKVEETMSIKRSEFIDVTEC